MKYGYYSKEHLEENEIVVNELISKAGAEITYSDLKKVDNTFPNRDELLKLLKNEDTLIIYRFMDIFHDKKSLNFLSKNLQKKSTRLISIKENIDTKKDGLNLLSIAKIYQNILAESKRDIIKYRIKKSNKIGIKGGRGKGLTKERMILAKQAAELYKNGESIQEILRITNLKKATFYRYLKLLNVPRRRQRSSVK